VFGLILAGSVPAAAQQGYGGGPGGGMGGGGGGGGGGGPSAAPQATLGALPSHDDPYTRAMKLKQKGKYAEAMPLLEAMAVQGHGFEVAQLELGKCHFDLALRAETPETVAHERTLGFAWVLSSANEGFGLAQQELVRLYLDGLGVPVDRVEAGKWYLLWRRNPSRMQIGANQFDAGLEARLKTSLNQAAWKDAQQRADQWHPSRGEL
jgi:hypothetical protein